MYTSLTGQFINLPQEIAEGRLKPMVAIRHHQPLAALNDAQLARTHCVPPSQIIAWVLPDRNPRYYGVSTTDLPYHPPAKQCPNPYLTDPALPPPANGAQADALMLEARVLHDTSEPPVWRRPVRVKATHWDVSESGINISFNLSDLAEIWGPGVYTTSIMIDIGSRPGTEIATLPLLFNTAPGN